MLMLCYKFTLKTDLKTCRRLQDNDNKQVNWHFVPRNYTVLTTELHFEVLRATPFVPRTVSVLPSYYTVFPCNYTFCPRTYTIEEIVLVAAGCACVACFGSFR